MNVFNPVPTSILDWMEASWLNSVMLDTAWVWITFEILHFLGMCLLLGSLIVMDLRLIGFGRLKVSMPAIHVLVPLAVAGFGINLITGIMFLFGNPYRYAVNISFQLKFILLLLAGINAIYFWRKGVPALANAGPNDVTSLDVKLIGLASLVLWTGVLCFGRLIPYLGTG